MSWCTRRSSLSLRRIGLCGGGKAKSSLMCLAYTATHINPSFQARTRQGHCLLCKTQPKHLVAANHKNLTLFTVVIFLPTSIPFKTFIQKIQKTHVFSCKPHVLYLIILIHMQICTVVNGCCSHGGIHAQRIGSAESFKRIIPKEQIANQSSRVLRRSAASS